MRSSRPDIERSATGRLAAETVAWLPHALTPQAGATWNGIDDKHATVSLNAAGHKVDIDVAIDDDGQLQWLSLQRWKDSAKPPGLAAFGGSTHGLYTASNGIAISGSGAVGWDWATPQQSDGEFFHYTITAARFLKQSVLRHQQRLGRST